MKFFAKFFAEWRKNSVLEQGTYLAEIFAAKLVFFLYKQPKFF